MSEPPERRSAETPVWPKSVSRAVRAAVSVGYGLALAGFILVLVGHELSFWRSLRDALIVLVLFGLPSVIAMLSQPSRSLMLLPAGIIGLLAFFAMGSILGLPLVILGLIWLWAYLRMAPPDRWARKASMILVPLLWLVATAMLWIHLDPACEQRLRDGTVIEVDPATRGFESGWIWQVGSTFSGSSGPISADVVSEACASNTLVAWEAFSAVALTAGAVLVGFHLSSPLDRQRETAG